jgi:tetratricopeptide (TPR) repeat protein
MKTRARWFLVGLALALLTAVVWHRPLAASGSGEEPPPTTLPDDPADDRGEEMPVDSVALARDAYNDGVKKMEKAKVAWTESKNDNDRAKAIKQFEKAAKKFSESLSYRPDYPEALNNLAFSLRLSGRYEEAMAHYNRAIQLKPDFMQAHEYRARAYLALDSVAQAKSEYVWLTENKHVDEAESLKVAIDAWVLAKAEGKKISVEKLGW